MLKSKGITMGLTDIIVIYFKRFLKVSSLLFIILTLLSSKVLAGVTFVDSFSVSSQDTIPTGLAFNTDGTKWNQDVCCGLYW